MLLLLLPLLLLPLPLFFFFCSSRRFLRRIKTKARAAPATKASATKTIDQAGNFEPLSPPLVPLPLSVWDPVPVPGDRSCFGGKQTAPTLLFCKVDDDLEAVVVVVVDG